MIIACDIGGVIKDQVTGEPIDGAIDSIRKLQSSHEVIFISKCKANLMTATDEWLHKHGLSDIKVYYCTEYPQKAIIASKHGVDAIIDDKMQVLQVFPSSIKKIWFCSKKENIDGAMKHQPDFIRAVTVTRNWGEVLQTF
jgi:hypothetical protein